MCGLLAVIAVLTSLPLIAPRAAAHRWEYRIDDLPDEVLQKQLDEHGDNGWELVFARRAVGDGTAAYEVIFKRPR